MKSKDIKMKQQQQQTATNLEHQLKLQKTGSDANALMPQDNDHQSGDLKEKSDDSSEMETEEQRGEQNVMDEEDDTTEMEADQQNHVMSGDADSHNDKHEAASKVVKMIIDKHKFKK